MSIQFKVFRISCVPDSEEEEALNKFIRSVNILTVHRNFVDTGSSSFTLFTVEYFANFKPQETSSRKKGKVDYREILSAEDFTLFARLREWRKEAATKEGIAVYTIFTNEQLAQIAGKRPDSKASLMKIQGIGEAKASKYGKIVLDCVAAVSKQQLNSTTST